MVTRREDLGGEVTPLDDVLVRLDVAASMSATSGT
jgi:hypothetical protein